MATPLSVLIVDDNGLARQQLALLLKAYPDISLVGEAASCEEAVKLLQTNKVDLVFLDVRLSDTETGFDLVPLIPAEVKIVFVTGFDQFAIRAFEINALDYIVKPITPERLSKTLKRVGQSPEEAVPVTTNTVLEPGDRILVKAGDNHRAFIEVQQIVTISSMENYSVLWVEDGKEYIERKSLARWVELLPAQLFVRVNRNSIINGSCVTEVRKGLGKPYQVVLRGVEEPFVVSRRNSAALKHCLQQDHIL